MREDPACDDRRSPGLAAARDAQHHRDHRRKHHDVDGMSERDDDL